MFKNQPGDVCPKTRDLPGRGRGKHSWEDFVPEALARIGVHVEAMRRCVLCGAMQALPKEVGR